MRVAITGSSGLIGRALAAALAARGDEAVAVVRRAPGPDEIGWDLPAGRIEPADLSGIDAVVHLAGEGIAEGRWTRDRKRAILESRLSGTSVIAEAIAGCASPPAVLVSASAIGWYGDRGDEVLDESSTRGSGFLSDVCAGWEAAADPARRAGTRVTHPRFGIVLSTEGGALAAQLPLFRLGLGGRIGRGDQWWSWVHIGDAVAAVIWMLDGDVSGPVNVTAPAPVTNAAFTRSLAAALRRPAALRAPRFGLHARFGRELAQALLYTSARVVPARLSDGGFGFGHPDLDGAFADLVARRRGS